MHDIAFDLVANNLLTIDWRPQPNEEDGPEESLTSKEFDRFLAERAAAADTLPTITSQAGATTAATPSPRAKAKKEEESLMAL